MKTTAIVIAAMMLPSVAWSQPPAAKFNLRCRLVLWLVEDDAGGQIRPVASKNDVELVLDLAEKRWCDRADCGDVSLLRSSKDYIILSRGSPIPTEIKMYDSINRRTGRYTSVTEYASGKSKDTKAYSCSPTKFTGLPAYKF